MKILEQTGLDFDDVLIVPNRNRLESRSQVKVTRDYRFYHSPKLWRGTPIICSNMPSVASLKMANTLQKYQMITCLHKYYSNLELSNHFSNPDTNTDYQWISIGMKDEELKRIPKIDLNICIDVPNGYIEKFVKFCAKVRNEYPNSIILAGNVCTSEMTQELIIHGGVDIVKLFVGPGRACRTRITTGVSYPTLTSTIECSSVAHGLKFEDKRLGLVCADGGFRQYGDICKGFVAGADFCMSGLLFSATDETDIEWFEEKEGKYSLYYGLSTHYSQQKHGEGYKDYRASEGSIQKIKYRGSVENIIKEMLGNIRSCCTYIGSDSIKDMNKCGNFIKIYNTNEKSLDFFESSV